MPQFSPLSNYRLATCHPDLIRLFNEVIKNVDCSIICGHRNQEDQDKAFADGFSKLKYPHGKHNAIPSNAVDVCPDPIDWKDVDRFKAFSDNVKAKAKELNIAIIWGGDWDDSFKDYPHYELHLNDGA